MVLKELLYFSITHEQITLLRDFIGIFTKYYTKQLEETSGSSTGYCTM